MNKPYSLTTLLSGLLAAWVFTACLGGENEGESGGATFPGDLFFTRLFFLSNDTGYAGTITGDIYRTENGGLSWSVWSRLYENTWDAQPHVTALYFNDSLRA